MRSNPAPSRLARLAALLVLLAPGTTLACGDQALVAWSYRGENGPDRWAALSPDYAACAGRRQSPVELRVAALASLPWLLFDYRRTAVLVENDGHTIRVDHAPGSFLTVGEERYTLEQIHFHAPGEHVLDGRPADMEMHLVHAGDDGRRLVVGVPMVAARVPPHPALERIWSQMPARKGASRGHRSLLVSARKLLPDETGYFTYEGSLTTPPCTEGVRWIVMKRPVYVHPAQVARLQAVLGASARPVQPLNGRTVRETP